MSGAALKTLFSLLGRLKDPEETIEPGEFQVEHGGWPNGCETNVPIPFDGPFQAAQQQVHGVLIHLTYAGTIQHNAWPLHIHAALQFAKEEPPFLDIQFLG